MRHSIPAGSPPLADIELNRLRPAWKVIDRPGHYETILPLAGNPGPERFVCLLAAGLSNEKHGSGLIGSRQDPFSADHQGWFSRLFAVKSDWKFSFPRAGRDTREHPIPDVSDDEFVIRSETELLDRELASVWN